MNRGIYPILSGALAQERRLQVISNNLANSNTTAYKRDEALFQSVLAGAGGVAPAPGVQPVSWQQPWAPGRMAAERVFVSPRGVSTALHPGRLHATRNPLDLAIQGPGFFEINTPQGIRYTRNGIFHLTAKHQLVTEQGYPVMGRNGPIKLTTGDVQISPSGTISENGQEVAALKIVEFPSNQPPQKMGDGLFAGENAKRAKEPAVVAGHLEESDVNAIGEMVQMIEVMRNYESAQRLVQTFDHMSELAIQEVGRVV
jgi:flagellar basal-body rod protein FlgF